MPRVLFLMRHAKAEDFAASDKARRLSAEGRRAAALAGEWLRGAGIQAILTSPAARAQETAATLGLDVELTLVDELYGSTPDVILEVLAGLPAAVGAALVVAHSPGIPALLHELTQGTDSDPEALAAVANHFPTATLVRLESEQDWADLDSARLVAVRIPE